MGAISAAEEDRPQEVPEETELAGASPIAVSALLSRTAASQGAQVEAAVVVDIPAGLHAVAETSISGPQGLSLRVVAPGGLTVGSIAYPKVLQRSFPFADTPISVYEGRAVFIFPVKVAPDVLPGAKKLTIFVSYQLCSDTQCFRPDSRELVLELPVVRAETPTEPANSHIFERARAAPPPNAVSALLARWGYFVGLLLIFVAGLAMNLTPCVYPLIPITVGFFIGQGGRRRAVMLALSYGLGLALSYSALGLLSASTGMLFGAWLQSPAVLAISGAAFLLFGLAMLELPARWRPVRRLRAFRLFSSIRPPAWLTTLAGTRRGWIGSLLMGIAAAIAAVPCSGPFVAAILVFAAATGRPLLGFGVFFAFALGLAIPLIVLALLSGLSVSLPRSGPWTGVVRKFFGVVLVGVAVYLTRPLFPRVMFWPAAFAVAALGGGYLLVCALRTRSLPARILGAVALALCLALVGIGFAFTRPKAAVRWTPYSDQLLSAAREAGTPVIMDFSAEWCFPCQQLDALTFSNPEVVKESSRFVALRVDLTSYADPDIVEVTKRYKVLGVPTIIFVNSRGHEEVALRTTSFATAAALLAKMRNVN